MYYMYVAKIFLMILNTPILFIDRVLSLKIRFQNRITKVHRHLMDIIIIIIIIIIMGLRSVFASKDCHRGHKKNRGDCVTIYVMDMITHK